MSPQASSEEKAGDGPPPRPATPATRPPSSRQQQRKLERQQQEAASAPAAAVAAAPATAAPATADAAAAVPTRLLAAAEALDPAFASFDVVQEAPVFHPTAEEFTDPLGYIAKIRPLAEGAGMCRIIPPEGWAPPFTIDPATFKFPTRVQNISRLGAGARLRKDFEMRLRKFMFKRGTPLAGPVHVDKKGLTPPLADLYGLFKAVAKDKGSFEAVTAPEEWEELATALGLAQGRGQALRNTYRQALLPFEQWQRQQQRAKEQGQEEEPAAAVAGTPRTPSVKREQMQQEGAAEPSTTTTTTEEEAATAAAASAPASLTKGTRARTGSKPLAAAPAESAAYAKLVEDRRAHVGGKMVLGKKFWRFFPPQGVWMLGTVTGVEKGTRIVVRYDPEEEEGKPKEGRGKGKGKGPLQPAAAQPAPVQVRRFTETMGKRDALVLLANGASKEGARAIQEGEEFCEGCLRTRVFGAMAECYECGALRHAPCMDPPLKHLPYGDWFCPDCADAPVGGGAGISGGGKMGGGMGGGGHKRRKMMAGTKGAAAPGVEELFASFGFEDGGDYSLEGYKQMADAWKAEHFGGPEGEEVEVEEDEVEREFWRVISGAGAGPGGGSGGGGESRFRAPREVKVEYGSEIDTGVHGSAFPVPASLLKGMVGPSTSTTAAGGGFKKGPLPPPIAATTAAAALGPNGTTTAGAGIGGSKKAEREWLKTYERSGWNINNLPVATGSMLHHLDVPVTGVVVPWLYVGMALSAFCWHAEDHYLYSINYLHAGNPKGWYAIPGAHADRFEALVQQTWPELFERNPDLMLQLVTMVDPRWIASKGIPVFRGRQREGQFVVTFPQAYHGGLNFGFNVAEAVNFAPPDFLPWGGKAQELYRRLHRSPVFSQDQLVVAAAKALLARPHPRETAECLPFVLTELERMRAATTRRAALARSLGVGRFVEGAAELSLELEEEDGEDGEEGGGGGGEGVLEAREGRRGKMGGGGGGLLPHLASTSASQGAGGGQQPRHGLLKGPRCAVCNQYCFMEMITCSHCFPPHSSSSTTNTPLRAVCGEHTAHACSLPPTHPHTHPPAAFVYRQRCPEPVMAAFQQQLQTRRAQLGAWREGLTAFLQVGDRAPAAAEARAGAVWDLLELGPTDRLQSLAVGGRTLRLEGRDPCVQRLTHMAGFLARYLGSEEEGEGEGEGVVEWAGKPAVAALAELHKRGRELGAARHELRGLARALRACQAAADGAKRLLPEGVTKQGHLRLKQKGSGGGARRRGGGEAEGGDGGGRKGARRRTGGGAIAGTATPSATEAAAAAAAPGALGLEALMALIAALLDFPYRLDRELAAAFRLLGAVTRARRRSWELLGVRVGEEFAVLDALLHQAARRLFPQLRAELEGGGAAAVSPLGAGAELEGAPRFYPQGIAPGAASGGGDGAATVVSSASAAGGGGKKRKGQERAYRMVKGRWEGRRFAFLPGPNVWLGVERLSKELRLLGVACPEWELLVDRGNLVLSEDLRSEEEGDGGGKKRQKLGGGGKSEKRAPGRKKGWCTALPFAVGKAQAAARGPRKAKAKVAEAAPGFFVESSSPLASKAAEGKSGSGAGVGGGGDAAMVVG